MSGRLSPVTSLHWEASNERLSSTINNKVAGWFFFSPFFFLFYTFAGWLMTFVKEANSGEISIRGKQLGCRTFCTDSRCAYVGDAGAFIRLLLGLSSNLHTLMEVETVCLRWETSTLALLPLCPVVASHGKNKGKAFQNVEVSSWFHTALLYLMIDFWLCNNCED